MYKSIEEIAIIQENLKQVAREIYYCMINKGWDANLQQALNLLGIFHPQEVGLSNRVLDKIHRIGKGESNAR